MQHTKPKPVVRVTIEIPRWSFAKYAMTEQGGHVEFFSPLPCPFNYGFVKDASGGDGLPLDAIVLGPGLRRGSEGMFPVVAIIRFLDAGQQDDKLVCSADELNWLDTLLLKVGFRIYVGMKRFVNWAKEKRGVTRYLGMEEPKQNVTSPEIQ